jgi:hypothetical protein
MSWLIPTMLGPIAAAMLFSPGGRLFLVTGAALLVFTPGQAALGTKVAFVAIVLISSAVSVLRLRNTEVQISGGLRSAAACYAVALIVAGLIGWTDDIEATLQNGLPYLLLLLVLPIAIDAGLGSGWRFLETGLIVVGITAALSFTLFWLDRRGIASLGTSRLLAYSLIMPALLFQWGLMTAGATSRPGLLRLLAIAVSSFVPIAFLITGTRTALVFSAGLVAATLMALAKRGTLRTVTGIVVSVAVVIPLLAWLGPILLNRPDFVTSRLASLQSVFAYGTAADTSLQQRQMATQAVLGQLDGHWLFGTGLSTPDLLLNFDTPISPVMRIGLIGAFFLVLYVVLALRWAMNMAGRDAQGDYIRRIIIGWFLIVIAYGALIPPVDDPLFAFAFAIAIALAVNACSKAPNLSARKSQRMLSPANRSSDINSRNGSPLQRPTPPARAPSSASVPNKAARVATPLRVAKPVGLSESDNPLAAAEPGRKTSQ